MSILLFTIVTLLLSKHEFLFFNDGHLEIEDPMRNFQDDSTLEHVSLDLDQVRALRAFLNQPEIVTLLEQ